MSESNIFIDKTKEIFDTFSFYENFMRKSTNNEFLKSQTPFYYAVESFPRALCYLASLIPNTPDRLKIAENIWEEHGCGDFTKFHTATFSNFLFSICNKNPNMFTNPKIEKWIKSWFEEKSVYKLSLKLAAIEYLYAPISESISEHCDKKGILQDHYKKHSVIDWDHGYDLLEVAVKYQNEEDDDMLYRFSQYQQEFINIYKSMVVITEYDIETVAKQPISFYYLRENSDITSSWISNNFENVVVIGSGGESIINILDNNKYVNLLVIDMNPNQLHLVKDKVSGTVNKRFTTGKFEEIFKLLRDRFSYYSINNIYNHDELKFALDDIFTNNNLSKIFGEDAVKYTTKSFSEHFFKVFTSRMINDFDLKNFSDIFTGSGFEYEKPNTNSDNTISYMNTKITDTSFVDKISEHFNNSKINVIDLSNIGDWIPLDNLISILENLYPILRDDGVVVLRRLLGDYSLKHILEKIGYYVTEREDRFYEETVIGIKKCVM